MSCDQRPGAGSPEGWSWASSRPAAAVTATPHTGGLTREDERRSVAIISSAAMSALSSVSISVTSAVVYAVSGTIFALLIFLLVLMGVSNCDCKCSG